MRPKSLALGTTMPTWQRADRVQVEITAAHSRRKHVARKADAFSRTFSLRIRYLTKRDAVNMTAATLSDSAAAAAHPTLTPSPGDPDSIYYNIYREFRARTPYARVPIQQLLASSSSDTVSFNRKHDTGSVRVSPDRAGQSACHVKCKNFVGFAEQRRARVFSFLTRSLFLTRAC